ncbi:MAG TPA: hypothetical protein VMS65_02060 [Polyangiaceae bacterium]|nr:hypothetical protein [Polyangiaceae bacterium]
MLGREPRLLSLVVGVIGALGIIACGRREGESGTSASTASAKARASTSAPTPPIVASATAHRRDPSEPTVLDESPMDGGLPGIALRELSDVGPAGPATATEDGVVMLTKSGHVALARVAKGPVRKGKIGSVSEPSTAFAVLGRSPAVAGGFAYWVTGGRLVRRRADGSGELEPLSDDARDGTRVAAAAIKTGVAVAYVTRPDAEGTSRVKLWLGPGRTVTLTPEGAGASSVAIAPLDARLIAVSIDARSAMTPVHARSISVDGAGPPELGPDVVAWIAGPAHSFTEVSAGSDGTNAWALLPIERDASHFGLATVPLGSEPAMDAPVAFLDYENGIDLAPVATARLCGKPYVALARPTAAAPHSPQELVLAPIAGGQTAIVANAAGFAAVSLAAVPEGGLVVYVADGRTWARGLECR